jgi:hypothetical protein
MHTKKQDQQWCHQRAAADAGKANDRSDHEARNREEWVNGYRQHFYEALREGGDTILLTMSVLFNSTDRSWPKIAVEFRNNNNLLLS